MINVGDVVKLKSGGPFMTVSIVNPTEVYCKWFDTENHLNEDSFPKDSLDSYEMSKMSNNWLRKD